MMHKAWSTIKDVPYCFSRSCVKLQGLTAKKTSILTQIGRFQTVTPVWIHRWLWKVTQSLKQQRRDALLFSKVIQQISRSLGGKTSPILTQIERFWTIGRSQLSNPSGLPCLLLSTYKTIAFHNTTNDGCWSARIVIVIYNNQILYEFEACRKCGVDFIHTHLASPYANAPQ